MIVTTYLSSVIERFQQVIVSYNDSGTLYGIKIRLIIRWIFFDR
jgi:hypothetical protein